MPITPQIEYSNNRLQPFIAAERSLILSRRFQAGLTVRKGSPLGASIVGQSAVQTLSLTGNPTGGTFRLVFRSVKTVPMAFDAAASTVQAALEALATIGAGNIVASGGPLPGGTVQFAFAGALANAPQPLILFEQADNLLTGGTNPTGVVAQTVQGVAPGALKLWSGELVAPPPAPSVSAVSGGTVFGDGTNAAAYAVTVTFYNESGETTPSQAAQAVVTGGNRTIRVAAIPNVGPHVQGARFYVNGALAGQALASGGTIPQTDLTGWAPGGGAAPSANGCFAARDGSHRLVGFAVTDVSTDAAGSLAFGAQPQFEHGGQLADAPVYVEGVFRIGDLQGVTAANGPQLSRFGRFLHGDWSNPEALFRIGAL